MVFEEHHRHTIAIGITRAKETEGGGADAPCQEKAIAVLAQYIGNLLENSYVRERQHCNERYNNEVFQDAASRMAHKLYSNSWFASAIGKFCMSLQEDILQTTNVQLRGGRDDDGHDGGGGDKGGHDNGDWEGVRDGGGGCDGSGGRYSIGGQNGKQDGSSKQDCGGVRYGGGGQDDGDVRVATIVEARQVAQRGGINNNIPLNKNFVRNLLNCHYHNKLAEALINI